MKSKEDGRLAEAQQHLFVGEFEAAHKAAQKIIKNNSNALEGVLVLAAIALEHDNAAGAAKLCSMVRERGYESCWLVVLEARVALLQQHHKRARERALAAATIGTHNPHIANQLGVVLARTGNHDRSVELFRIAVNGVPKHPDYCYNFAVALQFAGDLSEARAEFERLIELKPDHAKGWLALTQLSDEPDPSWSEKLERLFASSEDVELRLVAGHALARISETRKDWDASLEWLDKAKAAKAQQIAHDRSDVDALSGAASHAAERASPADQPTGDQTPIFIVGMPRSGTTLVERIITSHPKVAALGELSDFAVLLKRQLATPGDLVLEPALIEAAAASEDLSVVGAAYLDRIRQMNSETTHLVDKMPFNAFLVPAILKALPGARVICLRRSPFDVLFANYRQLFATGFGYYSYAYDFGHTAHFVANFEQMATAYENTLPSGRFLPVRYEDVVNDQRHQTERLLKFCGLEWDDACMDFHRNAQPVATASSVQVRSPIYASSVEKWRRYTDGAERAEAELAKYGITPL